MGKKRILFIDNRPGHLRQPILRLRLAGYEVDEAASGAEGLKALRQKPYDLLILDAELPEEDGWDVLRRVRKDQKLKGLMVIVFFGFDGSCDPVMIRLCVAIDSTLGVKCRGSVLRSFATCQDCIPMGCSDALVDTGLRVRSAVDPLRCWKW